MAQKLETPERGPSEYSRKVLDTLAKIKQGRMTEIVKAGNIEAGEHSSRIHAALQRLVKVKAITVKRHDGFAYYCTTLGDYQFVPPKPIENGAPAKKAKSKAKK